MSIEDPDLTRNAALSAFVEHISTVVQEEAEKYAETMGGIPQIQIICVTDQMMETCGLNIDATMMTDAMTDIIAAWIEEGRVDPDDFDSEEEGDLAPSRPN